MVRFITPLLALLCASAVIASPTSSDNGGAVYNQVPQHPGTPRRNPGKMLAYGALGALAGGALGKYFGHTKTGALAGSITGALYGSPEVKQKVAAFYGNPGIKEKFAKFYGINSPYPKK
ncbi:hypothetical protein IWQ62_004450 [Dispira parvispora]|uniref:Glycine zipper 2TM domain-containing protein n=1 Tax=Dispira parvispora TaxID=1520584 RepID=A0A9W8ALW3_9FUNG|nr:hypothetical protein IWQ62_004450 [Dispira parvispora]